MIDFNMVNGKVVVDATTLTVKAFNDIWEFDPGKLNKPKASNMLTYIFHMCDLREKNPFKDLPYDQKDAVSRRNAFGDKDYKFKEKEAELINKGMQWYEVLNANSIMRLSSSMDTKIDQISAFLDDPKNNITTFDQLDEQSNVMSRVEKILASKRRTDEFVRDELTKTKVKGNVNRSPLSSGILD